MTRSMRTLGTGGPAITPVGFGAWATGGGGWVFGWGPQDDQESIAAMRRAMELGVNWIDTAAAYGLGHSEEVVGRFLTELSADEQPLVFTKCGVVWPHGDPHAMPERVLHPDSIRRECEASLRRLGIERIDLYQFHWPDESGIPVEDSWDEMMHLIDEGKVRWGGVSNFDVARLARCERIRHVQSLQPPLSLIRREAAAEVLSWCREHDTGVICYSPMQAGLLTDAFTASRVSEMPKDDWRSRSADFHSPQIDRNLALRDALRPVAQRHGVTVAAVAVAWTLAWSGVTGAIVGARRPDQVDGWIGALDLELDATDLDAIADSIVASGAGTGPARP